MALNPVSHQFLRDVDTATGQPVQVGVDAQLQPPLLTFIQFGRGAVPIRRLAGEALPLNADGVNPEALAAIITAFKRLLSLSHEGARAPILQAALLGQNGLRFQDPTRIHQLDGIPEALTALEIASLIHAGVQMMSPGAETGLPFEQELKQAQRRSYLGED